MRCRELVDRHGCDNYSDCENEIDGPGANLVLNSFVSLNNVGTLHPSRYGLWLTSN